MSLYKRFLAALALIVVHSIYRVTHASLSHTPLRMCKHQACSSSTVISVPSLVTLSGAPVKNARISGEPLRKAFEWPKKAQNNNLVKSQNSTITNQTSFYWIINSHWEKCHNSLSDKYWYFAVPTWGPIYTKQKWQRKRKRSNDKQKSSKNKWQRKFSFSLLLSLGVDGL